MAAPRSAPRRPSPFGVFVIVAFGGSWVVAVPLALAEQGAIDLVPPAWMHALVAVGPAAGAVAASAALAGSAGVIDLLRRLSPATLRGPVWWLAALSPLAIAAGVIVVVGLVDSIDWTRLGDAGAYDTGSWPIALLVMPLSFGVLEELGWRGFALPWWQRQHTAAGATWRLWLLWAAWHAPMFGYHFEPDLQMIGWFATLYFGAVWLTFLFNATGGSVFAVAVWHSTYNLVSIGGEAVAPATPILVSMAIVAAAVVVGRRFGSADLSPSPRTVLAAPDSQSSRRAVRPTA